MKGNVKGVTRRSLGLALTAMPAAAVMAQQPPTEDLAALAREQLNDMSQQLRSFKVPIATEPSFTFRP